MSLNNVVAVGFQMADPDLDSISGLAHANSNFIVSDGTEWVVETGATVRSSLGLGTAAVAATGISNTNVPVFTTGVADDDFLRVAGTSIEGRSAAQVLSDIGAASIGANSDITSITGLTTDLAVAHGGTGLGAIAKGSILAANSANTLSVIDGTTSDNHTAVSADKVLFWDATDDTVSWNIIANVCFLKGTKITLPDYSQKNIEDLTLADDVLTYNIDGISNIKDKNVLKNVQLDSMNGKISQSGIRNIWINPTDSYLVINGKLKVTKNHIVHFKRGNQYYFRFAGHLTIGDELFTDKDKYESIDSIEEIREKTNVYNFELDKDNTYFAENYLVHHYCELCSGYSKII
jgi:hypothetical protein